MIQRDSARYGWLGSHILEILLSRYNNMHLLRSRMTEAPPPPVSIDINHERLISWLGVHRFILIWTPKPELHLPDLCHHSSQGT